ncbi:GCP1 [Scenedesmus sp. PABB004]|nr:GCP1 [Scenedesmus sp. PABB004]
MAAAWPGARGRALARHARTAMAVVAAQQPRGMHAAAALAAAAAARRGGQQPGRCCAATGAGSAVGGAPPVAPGRPLLVLGIESSCDDTGAAVVSSDGRVLGEALATQAELHAPWGGVVPSLAQQAHREAIDRVVASALAQAGVGAEQLDAVAVTVGPGLSLCLDVGVRKARALSRDAGVPLVPVHHMEAHALVARMVAAGGAAAAPGGDGGGGAAAAAQGGLPFPFLCLLVSGGHNLLVLVRGVGSYVQLGTTLDDALGAAAEGRRRGGPGARPRAPSAGRRAPHLPGARARRRPTPGRRRAADARAPPAAAGEAYDKVGRMLGLDLTPNGGAAVEAAARRGDAGAYAFAVPMKKYGNCDFSYAGLKTSVRLAIERSLGSAEGAGKRASAGAPRAAPGAAGGEAGGSEGGSEGGGSSSCSGSSSSGSSSEGSSSSGGSSEGSGGGAADAAREQVKADIAASFQKTAVAHLVMRLRRAVGWAREECPGLAHLVVAGGVASNQYVRQQVAEVAEETGLTLVVPPARWCTDNGAMVGWAGIERYGLGLVQPPAPPLPEDGSPEWVELRPRWPLTSDKHAKSMPPVLSMRKPDKQAASLTDMTRQELDALAAARAGGTGGAGAQQAAGAVAAAAAAGPPGAAPA